MWTPLYDTAPIRCREEYRLVGEHPGVLLHQIRELAVIRKDTGRLFLGVNRTHLRVAHPRRCRRGRTAARSEHKKNHYKSSHCCHLIQKAKG